MAESLNDIMSFDRVVCVGITGLITPAPDVNPYFELNVDTAGNDEFSIPAGWTLMSSGYTAQYGYNGPIMHSSESIGGRLERDIRDTPGYYVALEVSARCDYDGSTDCDEDTGCSCEPAGWTVAYHEPAAPVSFRADRAAPHEVTAVFSGVQGTRYGVPNLQCYAHNGQHGTCSRDWYRGKTRPATPEEYAPLLSELQSIGYIVTVVQRVTWSAA